MHDDTVMTSWKRLTAKAKRLWSDHAKDAGANTSVALEKPPTVPTSMTHADREEDPQAAPLAAWEDEGGRTLRSAQAPLRKV